MAHFLYSISSSGGPPSVGEQCRYSGYNDGGDTWRLEMAKTSATTSTLADDREQLDLEAWCIYG
jgi:hypothetical protein